MKLRIKKLHEDAILPSYAHPGDAGIDLFSREDYVLKAGERYTFNLGISVEIPEGYFGSVRDKSGLASKSGLTILAGVVDSSYRGEIGIVVLNTSNEDYKIDKGAKIAQMLIQPVHSCEIEEVQELSKTQRGTGGFGSTGKWK
ncbi:dUTP diphosphatase [Candidatus Pacearchaeota archaeon CG10_big_fil_rev_8_21_14_0_10_31_9]|nr:MAG: dUTP diphosphatase [Candidatus Pacearchaeota archaeon CG10_big_fil_rev_8_21_14_0_10_31_9]PIZ83005.1 MAG: dUTP diphosphatase [Candidatus Pacearchaeota archaeon CG_4_10_14_0_2_um_filter_05_32_18]